MRRGVRHALRLVEQHVVDSHPPGRRCLLLSVAAANQTVDAASPVGARAPARCQRRAARADSRVHEVERHIAHVAHARSDLTPRQRRTPRAVAVRWHSPITAQRAARTV